MKTIEPPESPNGGRRLRSGEKGEKKGGQIAVSGYFRAVAQMADVAWRGYYSIRRLFSPITFK
jgi:hypothetical protein